MTGLSSESTPTRVHDKLGRESNQSRKLLPLGSPIIPGPVCPSCLYFSAEFGQLGPILGQIQPEIDQCCKPWPILGQCVAEIRSIRPRLAMFGRCLIEVWPMIGPMLLSKFGSVCITRNLDWPLFQPTLAEFNRNLPIYVKTGPPCAQDGPGLVAIGQTRSQADSCTSLRTLGHLGYEQEHLL